MTTIRILDHITDPQDQFWNCFAKDIFLREELIKVHRFEDSLRITDITQAMKTGKECLEFTLRWNRHDRLPMPGPLQELLREKNYNFRSIFDHLETLDWSTVKPGWALSCPSLSAGGEGRGEVGVTVEAYRSPLPSSRTWSPFNNLHPLTELPKKWTIPHVLRCLFNGQFRELKCDMVLTDDYAYDNAAKFQQGPILHAWAFARKILESPSGWWAYRTGGEVSICCHHFDSNSFTPDLTMRYNPFAEYQSPPPPQAPTARGHSGRSSSTSEKAPPPSAPPAKNSALLKQFRAVPDTTIQYLLQSEDHLRALAVPDARSQFEQFLNGHPECHDWRKSWAEWKVGQASSLSKVGQASCLSKKSESVSKGESKSKKPPTPTHTHPTPSDTPRSALRAPHSDDDDDGPLSAAVAQVLLKDIIADGHLKLVIAELGAVIAFLPKQTAQEIFVAMDTAMSMFGKNTNIDAATLNAWVDELEQTRVAPASRGD